MKAIKSKKKVNACAFLRTSPDDVKFFLCATAAEGEPVGAAGRKTWGLFSRTRGLFSESGEEKAKIRGLFALALAEGRATLEEWRVGGAQGRRERVEGGRKGAQEAAVQELMRIFVAD